MSATSQEPLTNCTFTLFSTLPFELRCLIWKTTLTSRCVEVDYREEVGFTSHSKLPIALFISKESRDLVLPYYPVCFDGLFSESRVRFNFAIDTLYIDLGSEDSLPHLFDTFTPLEIDSLRYLALDESYHSEYGGYVVKGIRRIVSKLTGTNFASYSLYSLLLLMSIPQRPLARNMFIGLIHC